MPVTGTYVTSSRVASSTPMNQTFTRVTSQIDALAIELATISTLATGGVCWPMPRLIGDDQPEMHRIDADRLDQRHHDRHDEDDRRRRVQEHAEQQEQQVEQRQHEPTCSA